MSLLNSTKTTVNLCPKWQMSLSSLILHRLRDPLHHQTEEEAEPDSHLLHQEEDFLLHHHHRLILQFQLRGSKTTKQRCKEKKKTRQ